MKRFEITNYGEYGYFIEDLVTTYPATANCVSSMVSAEQLKTVRNGLNLLNEFNYGETVEFTLNGIGFYRSEYGGVYSLDFPEVELPIDMTWQEVEFVLEELGKMLA